MARIFPDIALARDGAGPQLSVVATSRNDDHGGSLLYRMQHFVDGFVAQCKRHDLVAELILVEWNPPPDRPPLADALAWPAEMGPCTVRIVTVPARLHARYAIADRLPLFQMIAKNVGIRRARGAFVLATNIDILFSDDLVRFMRDGLRRGRVYRVDRFDVPPEIPKASFEAVLRFCAERAFRVHRRKGTYLRIDGRWRRQAIARVPWARAWGWLADKTQGALGRLRRCGMALAALRRELPYLWANPARWALRCRRWSAMAVGGLAALRHGAVRAWLTRRASSIRGRWVARIGSVRAAAERWAARRETARLHTNACGDFSLMAREDWARMRGYPEWDTFSWHLDSVGLVQAGHHGIRQVVLAPRMCAYHIEHGIGSGYTPEGADALFQRLRRQRIPFLDWHDFLALVMRMRARARRGESVLFNGLDWGLVEHALPERLVGGETGEAVRPLAVGAGSR